MNSNQKKAKQLGISYGKACNQLKKLVLFTLLKTLSLDVCFRCQGKIEDVKDLSIEHKVAWLDSESPRELFFDLNNIAFSHLKCNSATKRHPHKKILPKGMYWCWDCKQYKCKPSFPPSKERKNKRCTKCASKYKREYRERTGKR